VPLSGPAGTSVALEEWNNQAIEGGIGIKREADLNDIRAALFKALVRPCGDRWTVSR
jgi:hypothetical protein